MLSSPDFLSVHKRIVHQLRGKFFSDGIQEILFDFLSQKHHINISIKEFRLQAFSI